MYTNQQRSIDKAYNLKNQSHKTGNNKAFSIVDTDFRQKSTTKTTSCNGLRKVRPQGKKPGKS